MSNVRIYIKSILIPLIVGAVVGFITSRFMDYSMLEKPFLAPPGILFPIVWTILYTLMGVSYGILKTKNLVDYKIDSIYYLQLFVNALGPSSFLFLNGDYLHLFGFYYYLF